MDYCIKCQTWGHKLVDCPKDEITARRHRELIDAIGTRINESQSIYDLCAEVLRLQEEIERLKRGEFICQKCGLRKDSEYPKGDF